MFMNEIQMLTGIDINTRYQSLVYLNIRSEDELYKTIDKKFRD